MSFSLRCELSGPGKSRLRHQRLGGEITWLSLPGSISTGSILLTELCRTGTSPCQVLTDQLSQELPTDEKTCLDQGEPPRSPPCVGGASLRATLKGIPASELPRGCTLVPLHRDPTPPCLSKPQKSLTGTFPKALPRSPLHISSGHRVCTPGMNPTCG